LKRARAGAVLFLSCDLPFVSPALLRHVLQASVSGKRSVFLKENGLAGFPFLLRVVDLPVVRQQLAQKQFSLQKLAAALRAKGVPCPRNLTGELLNVNTPEDWAAAQARWQQHNYLNRSNHPDTSGSSPASGMMCPVSAGSSALP
jgi:molybdopterin-guanine dinucleotide biosynthesis protein A